MNNLEESEFYSEDATEIIKNNSDIIFNENLPIYKCKSEIIKAVQDHQFVIIHGETGCGKTTQVPQYLYREGLNENSIIGITQPRRIAAQNVAKRVAKEMKTPLGKTVGYEVRFNKKTDSSTKIKYMTDGILLNECILDKNLKDYKVIMIDEAHERSVLSDVLLGLLRLIATKRPDLKVIISSATINVDKVVKYFQTAQVVSVQSRLYPVDVIYETYDTDYIEKTVQLCEKIHRDEMKLKKIGGSSKGDVLVFLTGQDEIFMCVDELKKIKDIVPLPLCSAVDGDAQQKVFDGVKPNQTKVVVATNIAETSVTIDGIKFVIDCGYVKQNRYNPRRGMEILEDVRISKSQAEQRSGRAGRTQPGVCHRLYAEKVYESFADEAVPEIHRKNLSGICLILRALKLDPGAFAFLDKPNLEEIERSEHELIGLSLMESSGCLTPMGMQITELPVSPILGKVLMTSLSYNCPIEVIKIVAMFSEKMQNIFSRPRKHQKKADAKRAQFHDPGGDHFMLLNLYDAWAKEHKNNRRTWCFKNFVKADAMENIRNVIKQIRYILMRSKHKVENSSSETRCDDIKKCFVAGYFTNICIRQPRDNYNRVIDDEKFVIYGNSTLRDIRPKIILFNDAIKSSKSFASGVMQLDEALLRENFQSELKLIGFPEDIDEQTAF